MKHAILTGRYGRSAPLPSARDLSDELRVNKNTVTKAYRELRAAGLIRIAPGRRATVADVPGRPHGSFRSPSNLIEDQVRSVLSPILREARLLGIPLARVLEIATNEITSFELGTARRVHLVECNPIEAQQYARDIADWLGIGVDWMLLDDLSGIVPQAEDVFVVPYYHLDDVAPHLPGHQLAGIHVAPDPEALFALIEAAQAGGVALICGSAKSAERFGNLFQYYATRGIQVAHCGDARGMHALLAESRTVFATPVALSAVERQPGPRPIPFPERIDPQSLHALRVLLSGAEGTAGQATAAAKRVSGASTRSGTLRGRGHPAGVRGSRRASGLGRR